MSTIDINFEKDTKTKTSNNLFRMMQLSRAVFTVTAMLIAVSSSSSSSSVFFIAGQQNTASSNETTTMAEEERPVRMYIYIYTCLYIKHIYTVTV